MSKGWANERLTIANELLTIANELLQKVEAHAWGLTDPIVVICTSSSIWNM
ncbi:hypothetical protein [Paenibacillus agri]|uniref:Uncharacterized protein n=1 Tax=Paenibacillus agri TaxID=2744309 RepID=A0A850EJD5_9BACL|nr:hypothetical protein [Paenibacillus agri]NUU59809.1 hypothetical protein [Paenibacillus agri]